MENAGTENNLFKHNEYNQMIPDPYHNPYHSTSDLHEFEHGQFQHDQFQHDQFQHDQFQHDQFDTSNHMNNKNDAIFDFQLAQDGQHQGVHSLSMRDLQGNQTSHIVIASERFAQQLDTNSIQEQKRFMNNGFDATTEMNSLFMQSKKHVEEHNYDDIISAYLTFTHGSNLLARDVLNSFKCSIIASMKLGDITNVCEAMDYPVPQQGLVRFEERAENIYGDYSEWQKIIHLLSFDDDVVEDYLNSIDSNFGNDHPTIKFVLNTLQQIGADSLSPTDSLKIYLLTNIKSITSIVAITAFLKDIMPTSFNTNDAAFIFTSYMADAPRYSDQQFSCDIAWFMKHVIINTSFEEKCFHFMETKNTMMKWSQSEAVKANTGRVRLRYRVGVQSHRGGKMSSEDRKYNNNNTSTSTSNDYSSIESDVISVNSTAPASHLSHLQCDSLQGWSLRARIPPAISHKSRLICYVLMGQTGFADPTHAIKTYCINDDDLSVNILEQKIYKAHADVIVEFLRLLTVQVEYFEELIAFQEECFTDFSHTDAKELSPLRVLQLYIAIYNNEDTWIHVWKQFCGVMSHQVLIAVGNFKRTHLYAVNHVAKICMLGDESSKRTVNLVS